MRPYPAAFTGLVVLSACLPLAAADLSEVVVTANRLPQSQDATLASTTVITRADIIARQARSIEDLLQGVDGFAISNSGGPGKLTSFFVRGADADQLLVLVDGVRIGSATAGTPALQNIPVELIERIEIVRGPRSSLYGSEAIGGVLQIFTRRGAGAFRPEVSVSGGSFDTRQAYAALGGGSERAWVQGQLGWQETDGINACRGSSSEFAGCFTEEPDRDAYRYRSATLRAGGQLTAATAVEASLLRAASRVEYDGSFANRSRLLQQVAGATLDQQLGERAGKLTLRLGRAWDRSHDYVDDSFQSEFETRRDSASAQWDINAARGQLVSLGVDYLNDHVDSSTAYDVSSRDNTGVFGQYVGEFGAWRGEGSLRNDDNEQFGSHTTGSAALGYTINPALQLLAQYGTGFRAPTFNELYFPADPFFGPSSNPDLDPERSRSLELALRGTLQAVRWRVSLYQTRIRDLISLDSNFLPANIDAARIRGVEASTNVPWQQWRFDAGVTWQDPESRTAGADFGNRLARRPKLAGHLDVERRVAALTLGARWVTEGDRYDNAAGTRHVGGYGLLDLRAEASVGKDWRVQLRAANLLDKGYETVSFYNQPGRAVYLTLRYAGGR
ncbi:MAG: TonB-dependent receptor [Steroidobacteraceae bacterium]